VIVQIDVVFNAVSFSFSFFFLFFFFFFFYRNITESQIDEIFSKYGNIVQKNILKDKLTGLPRGVAFVRYIINFHH